MEYVLGLALICLLFTVILLTAARRRADEAEKVADKRVQDALMRLGEDFRRKEKAIRADAAARSRSVVTGKVTEQLVPFMEEFDFSPRDARFLGSPIDFIVFEGLYEGSLDRIVFVEVKTGLGRLSKRERQVRNIIDEGEVYYEILHVRS